MYAINGLFLYRKITGVERYAIELIKQLDDMVAPDCIVIAMPYIPEELPIQGLKKIKYVSTGKRTASLNHNIWEQVIFPLFLKKNSYTGLNLCNSSPLLKPDIICIHDIFYKTFPQFFNTKTSKKMAFRRRINYWFAAHMAKKIMTVSQFSKKQIMENYGVKSEKIYVSYEGWEHNAGAAPDYTVFDKFPQIKKSDFYFSLGQISPHKNIKWVCEVAARNPRQCFVITGQNNFGSGVSGEGKIKNVVFTGYLSDGEVAALMLEMKALLFPSYCEGFGIPPMEALNRGKKVLMSNRTCLPEIYGDTVAYFDPDDYELNLEELLSTKVSSPENLLRKYTWKATAEQWKEWLEL